MAVGAVAELTLMTGKRKGYLPAVTADEFNLRINFHFLSSSHNDYGRVLNDNVLFKKGYSETT